MFNISNFLTNSKITLELVVWPMCVGFIIALGLILYSKNVHGVLIRKLKEQSAFSPDNAASLGELGLSGRKLIRFSLRRGSMLRKVVYGFAGEMPDETTAEKINSALPDKNVSLDDLKFYIPEKHTEKAETMYNSGGASILTVICAIVLCLCAVLLVLALVPWILGFLT